MTPTLIKAVFRKRKAPVVVYSVGRHKRIFHPRTKGTKAAPEWISTTPSCHKHRFCFTKLNQHQFNVLRARCTENFIAL